MSNPNETVLQLIDRLGLNLLESGGAVTGSMGDTLVTLTVLSVEPLSLLFALNINQNTSDVEIKSPPEAGFLPEACRINFENGRCWLSQMFILIIACVVGGLIGIPLGKTLRNSGVVRFAPVPLTLVITIGSLVAGEIGYVAIAIFHRFGIFDLTLAAQLSWRIVTNYTGFWIGSKVLVGIVIISCCFGEATQRKTERLNV